MVRVQIFGDSHIKRFNRYVMEQRQFCNDYFTFSKLSTSIVGISGCRVRRSRDMKVLEREVQNQRPKKLVLYIAENDIDSPHADEDSVKEVVLKLMVLCDLFVSRYRVNSIYICQLVPRFTTRHCPVDLYNKLIIVANQLLKQEPNKRSSVMYSKMKGLKNSKTENLCDGVHMNNIGNIKYYRAIRGAVIHAIKQNQ